MNFSRAVQLPFNGPNKVATLLIGTAVSAVPALVAHFSSGLAGILSFISTILFLGYTVAVTRQETATTAPNVSAGLPSWSDWKTILEDGLVSLVPTVAYSAVFALVAVLLLSVAGVHLGATTNAHAIQSAAAGSAIGLLLVVGLFAFAAFAVTFISMAVANYAHIGSLGAAFNVKDVFKKTVSNPVNKLATLGLVLVVLIVTGLFGIVPLIGAAFGNFLGTAVNAALFSYAYNASK